MLLFTEGNTTQRFVITIEEKTTLVDQYYLFVFEHITTKSQVKFIKSPADDVSHNTDRYNEFEIDVNALFSGQAVGQFIYRIYQQESATNTDETGLTEVENGKMLLQKAEDFEYTEYAGETNFKVYAR